MTVGAFLRWLPRRVWCSVVGHRFESAEVASRYGLVEGYTCERCEESTRMLWVWQKEVEES